MTPEEYAAKRRRERRGEYYRKHRDEALAYQKEYDKKNRDRIREYQREYQKAYREGHLRRGEKEDE